MTERSRVSDEPITPNGVPSAEPTAPTAESLEQRVRRLEEAVASLQDTAQLEARIAERVSTRVKRDPSHDFQDISAAPVRAGLRLTPTDREPVRPQPAEQAPQPSARIRAPWLLWDAYAEAQAMLRMYFDPRYRASRLARVVPPVLFLLILTSWLWLPGTGFLPGAIMIIPDKLIDLVLAFLAFKVLAREARRYREVIADLPIVPRS
jgi:hypothetical protein